MIGPVTEQNQAERGVFLSNFGAGETDIVWSEQKRMKLVL